MKYWEYYCKVRGLSTRAEFIDSLGDDDWSKYWRITMDDEIGNPVNHNVDYAEVGI